MKSGMNPKQKKKIIMSKLYIFGDSYSVSWKDRLKEKPSTTMRVYAEQFQTKYKRIPQHFETIIQTHFKLGEIINASVGGFDNYSILEQIGRVIPNITTHDYVIVGWSDITRIRYIDKGQRKWNRALINSPGFEKYIPHILQEQVLLRDSKLPMLEVGSWQNILLKSLPPQTIFWSPFIYDDNDHPYIPFQTPHEINPINIFKETNGKIDDYHFGNEGMQPLGEWMIELFKNNPYRKTQWI